MASTRVRLNVERKDFADGMSFGEVGPYERLLGKVEFALDPSDPRVAYVVDLDLATIETEYQAGMLIVRIQLPEERP